MSQKYPFIKYSRKIYTQEEMTQRSREYLEYMEKRRSVRDISDKLVPKEVIEDLIRTASTAPSGAHKQPWMFCAVSDAEIKKKIRVAAEEEEYLNYHGRMPQEWLDDLAPLATDWKKEFLVDAPWLIIVFRKIYDIDEDGKKRNNYYVNESVGIACGILLTAIHNAGLVALTHTPSPMDFLAKILNRPKNEKPFLLIPVGYPAENAEVPDLKRKPLKDIAQFY